MIKESKEKKMVWKMDLWLKNIHFVTIRTKKCYIYSFKAKTKATKLKCDQMCENYGIRVKNRHSIICKKICKAVIPENVQILESVFSWQLMTPLLLKGIIIQKLPACTNRLCIFVQYSVIQSFTGWCSVYLMLWKQTVKRGVKIWF